MTTARHVPVASLAVLALFAACANTPYLAVRPENPAPAGEEVGSWNAADGTQLWQRHWLPAAPDGHERGVVVIMHGLADHSDLYDRFARRAATAGYSVWAFDLRGHARSAGNRVDAPFDDYVDDLDKFIANVHAAEPTQPLFLMGHSMGGAIAALTTIERKPPIAGLILSSAALNLGVPPLKIAGARLAGVALPESPALPLDPKDFSSDPAVVAAMLADPWISHDTAPARTVGGLAEASARIWAGTDRLTMPLLVLHGTADRLTAPAGSRALVHAAPALDKTLHLYDGAWHVLLAEPNHEQIEDDLLGWLGAHTGGPAVTAGVIDDARVLRGDRTQSYASIMLGIGFAAGDGATVGVGELAVRLGKLSPIGWAGDVVVRLLGKTGWSASLMPVGFAIRPGRIVLGVAGGLGTIGPGANLTIPAEAWLELPIGPIHATASAQVDYLVDSGAARNAPLGADRAWFGVAVRAPADVPYWPHTFAGVGPYLAGNVVSFEGTTAFQLTAGLALYGTD